MINKWFKLMWQNGYIHLFLLFFTLLCFEVFSFDLVLELIIETFEENIYTGIALVAAFMLPITICLIIGYKGFYQFWNEQKK